VEEVPSFFSVRLGYGEKFLKKFEAEGVHRVKNYN
jgi:hypothetical protein